MDLTKELQLFAESRLKRSLTKEELKQLAELIKHIDSDKEKNTATKD